MSGQEVYRNFSTVNAKWNAHIQMIKGELLACEKKLASTAGAPPLDAKSKNQQMALQKAFEDLVERYNQACRSWLNELTSRSLPPMAFTEEKRIPWPSWVGPKGQDFVLRAIKQGGIPVTDSVTLKKAPGTWQGIAIEYNW